MGLFGRFLKGEPIYQPGDIDGRQDIRQQDPQQTQPTSQPDQPAQAQNQNATPAPAPVSHEETPIVRIGRVECNLNGQRFDVYAVIKNESRQPVLLDKIHMFGAKRELDRHLRSGESHQCLIYSGPQLVHEDHDYAEVFYRDDSGGQYFAAKHEVRYRRQSDNSIIVTECLLRGPVHHVH
jgi:hypothetical protein